MRWTIRILSIALVVIGLALLLLAEQLLDLVIQTYDLEAVFAPGALRHGPHGEIGVVNAVQAEKILLLRIIGGSVLFFVGISWASHWINRYSWPTWLG